MSFTDELENSEFQLNIIIEMGGETYARFQPDSGIVIPDENLIVGAATLQPFTVDIRDVKSSLPSSTFDLLDEDAIMTGRIGDSANQLLNEPTVIKVGFITGSFDFTDYRIFSSGFSTTITRKSNTYKFSVRENQDLQGEIFTGGNELVADLSDSETTTMFLGDVSEFFDQGTVQVNEEFITFTARDTDLNTLSNLTRSTLNSTAAEHPAGETVFQGFELEGNPLQLLLQLLISPGGGTVYDVLPDGLGIDATAIDVTGIEQLAIDNFGATLGVSGIEGGDQYRFFLANTGNALKFLEAEILQATNTRFVQKEGQTSIVLLDQAVAGSATQTMDEDTIIGTPGYRIGSDKLVNRITVDWNFSPGLNRYTRTTVEEDLESQTNFGVVKSFTMRFKGIQADLNGANIVRERATRLLSRLSSAQTTITAKTFLANAELEVGEEVNVQHRYLPDEGGTLGINDTLEVISRGFDLNSGTIKYVLSYTSFFGLRIGVIAPSPLVDAVTSLSIFDVPAGDGSCYQIGFCIIINGEERTIIDVTGDTITVDSDFTILTVGDIVKFCDYDKQSSGQKDSFASISQDENGFPSDSTKSYNITF